MGAGASAQLPATVDVATQRRLGGICYLDNRQEAYGDVADAEAVPRERVLAEVARRGAEGLAVSTPLLMLAGISCGVLALLPFASAAVLRINLR